MTSVSQFAQYLLKHDLKTNQARMTLFNFLKHVMDPALPFSPAVIQAFYARVLQFDHWQNDSANLSDTVRADIHAYVKQFCNDDEASAWARLRHPDTLQVVQLKVFQDLEDLVETEHAARRKSGDQIRLVRLSETQVLVIILAPSGNLEVKVYPAMAIVWGPKLRLVAPVTQLHYSAELELMPHVKQVLEGSLLTTHCFHTDFEGVHGLITRGATFQKFETFIRAKLPETQDLFNSLKKVERHFINPQSDPYYQEMVSRLERANRLLNNPNPDNLETAERALNKGRLCLKNVFPNDRLLTLLVTHLDYGINQKRSQNAPEPQTRQNSGPTRNPTQ
ncbi:MAG: hypothetical protein ACXVA9_10915 [Bdellovibrionales bacterium]